jgi:hypothetical protein
MTIGDLALLLDNLQPRLPRRLAHKLQADVLSAYRQPRQLARFRRDAKLSTSPAASVLATAASMLTH